jgi:hypothetical protein
MATTSERQDSVSEAATGLLHCLFIVQSRFLESREGICRHHLCPLVRVVSGTVPAREDVAEGAEEAVLWKWRNHCELLGELVLHLRQNNEHSEIAQDEKEEEEEGEEEEEEERAGGGGEEGEVENELSYLKRSLGSKRIKLLRVQTHIHRAEKQLTKHRQSGLEVLCGFNLLEQLVGKRFPRLEVLRKSIESGLVVAPVLHELRRQLHRIPLDVVDWSLQW